MNVDFWSVLTSAEQSSANKVVQFTPSSAFWPREGSEIHITFSAVFNVTCVEGPGSQSLSRRRRHVIWTYVGKRLTH